MATDSRKGDDKDRHMPVHNGGGDTLRRIEVITGTGRRRRWDAETKGRLVAESFEPGCSVSELARRHDISPSLLFLWRRQAAKNAESETPLPVLDPGRGKTKTCRLWVAAMDDRPWGGPAPPAVAYVFAEDRKGERATDLFAGFNGILQVDGYAGYNGLLFRKR